MDDLDNADVSSGLHMLMHISRLANFALIATVCTTGLAVLYHKIRANRHRQQWLLALNESNFDLIKEYLSDSSYARFSPTDIYWRALELAVEYPNLDFIRFLVNNDLFRTYSGYPKLPIYQRQGSDQDLIEGLKNLGFDYLEYDLHDQAVFGVLALLKSELGQDKEPGYYEMIQEVLDHLPVTERYNALRKIDLIKNLEGAVVSSSRNSVAP